MSRRHTDRPANGRHTNDSRTNTPDATPANATGRDASHRGTGDWHVGERLAESYAHGSITEPDAWSLEKHVESCGPCAIRVTAAVRRGAAGPVVDEIRAAVLAQILAPAPSTAQNAPAAAPTAAPNTAPPDSPAPTPARRSARLRWGARMAWAAGPALRGAWLASLGLVIAGALVLAYGFGFPAAHPLLLALAPVLPLAGVALSYGRAADPLYEITAATPSGGLRLLLTRTAAVLAVSVPLLTAAGALLPAGGPGSPATAAWLLPGLALTLATLALGSYTGCRVAACTVSCCWLAAVSAPLVGTLPEGFGAELARYVSGPAVQSGWAAAALACAGLLALRRSSFNHLERL